MNWYKKIIAMPLPRGDYGDVRDELMTHEIYDVIPKNYTDPEGELDILSDEENEEEGIYPSYGSFGIVYQHPKFPDRVIKYTVDESEYEGAELVMRMQNSIGGFLDHIIGIYSAEIIDNTGAKYDDPVIRLVTEKLQTLSKKEEMAITDIKYMQEEFVNHSPEEMLARIEEKYGKKNGGFFRTTEELFNAYNELLAFLNSIGFSTIDALGANIGYRDGKLVLLDLGMAL